MTGATLPVKEQGAAFWDQNPCGGRWATYTEFLDWIRRTEPYIYAILDKYDWHGRLVAEIGCGQGTTANYLPAKGARVVGLDMSFESLRQARAGSVEMGHQSRVRLVRGDAERPPFPDGRFDVAISIGVLHHTVDTAGGVRELHRLLKPGGVAIVMLYRSGNPKWWATRLLRSGARFADRVRRRGDTLVDRVRARTPTADASGTALLELFGVPILKAFSNRQARRMFGGFETVTITNHQPGFRRMADVVPALRRLERLLAWVDRHTVSLWGFYQVIEATRGADGAVAAPRRSPRVQPL